MSLENRIPINTTSPEVLEDSTVPTSQPNKSQNSVVSRFNQAFAEASPIIQAYITNDKLTTDIELICKIEKLDDPNAQTIIENISVSILVGLLSFAEAKNVMIESFKASGIVINQLQAINIMNDIDKYILSNVRREILDTNLKKTKVIKHLTVKEKEEALAKEELRKILLNRTGNLTGQSPIFQYKKVDITQPKPPTKEEMAEKNQNFDRESLLKKLNLDGISNEEGASKRMEEIQQEVAKEVDSKKTSQTPPPESAPETTTSTDNKVAPSEENLSYVFAKRLKDQLASNLYKKVDLDKLRQARGKAEAEDLKKQQETSAYAQVIDSGENSSENEDPDFDPYRETI